jgi:uncharacterized protein (TIGR01777 family)
MRVVIAGGSGFLGRALRRRLAARGADIVVLTRRPNVELPHERVRAVEWDPNGHPGAWAQALDGADAVVNLAGAGIADQRWSAARKAELKASRVLSTRSLVAAVRQVSARPAVFVQGSAIGFYGVSETATFDESCPPGDDFFGQMAVAWEAEAHPVDALGVRLVFIRGGVVLAREGGALPRLITPFQFFVGGSIASGRQIWSWIHLDDWVSLVTWAIDTPSAAGVYNATAPAPVSYDEFAAALGRALHRPSWLRVPGFALRVLVGELATHALIQGQRVVPRRALEAGFTFTYPTIAEAMPAAVAPARTR